MNTIQKRKAYALERMRERSKFPSYRHNPTRGLYDKYEWNYVSQDWQDSATVVLWERLEQSGLVRLAWRPGTNPGYEDLAGDCFDIEKHPRVPGGGRALRSEEQAFRDKIERDGVWGLVGEYRLRPCEECSSWNYDECAHAGWQHGDGVWDFVGWDAAGYELGIQEVTVRALVKHLKERRGDT